MWDTDLKAVTDEAVPNYLNSLKFNQSHWLGDVRLSITGAMILVGALTFYADWKANWPTKNAPWLPIAVAVYFGLNGILKLWTWFVERGVMYSGQRDGIQITISSHCRAHEPIYRLSVTVVSKLSHKEQSKAKREGDDKVRDALAGTTTILNISAPFSQWFTDDGCFVALPLQRWIASSIPFIVDFDPRFKSTSSNDHLPLNASNDDVSPLLAGASGSSVIITDQINENTAKPKQSDTPKHDNDVSAGSAKRRRPKKHNNNGK